MAVTLPEIDAWTGAETKPVVLPIFFPFFTSCPMTTSGFVGAPICWLRGIIARLGIAAATVGLCAVRYLLSAGCTPPLNVSRACTVVASILSHLPYVITFGITAC